MPEAIHDDGGVAATQANTVTGAGVWLAPCLVA
jgi:hypothetical protein